MGKRLITQRRGKGSGPYKSASHRFVGRAKHAPFSNDNVKGVVKDFMNCPGHSAPLAAIEYENGNYSLMIAPEGLKVNTQIESYSKEVNVGNTQRLKDIPEGTAIFNIESIPGDGGKFVRSSGTCAKIVTHTKKDVTVILPSKKKKSFNPNCRATVGVVAAGGRTEKPFVKAGNKYYKMRARNKLFPHVCGLSMNAVDHPFGGSNSSKKNFPDTIRRNAPPGANVGKIRASRTGRRKRRKID